MADLTINFNGQAYHLACQNGEEEHLARLAAYVDSKAKKLAGKMGSVGDNRLLLMTAILIADELEELKGGAPLDASTSDEKLQTYQKSLKKAAKRINDITRALEEEG